MMKFSLLIPSRGRPHYLEILIRTLISKAKNPERAEILIALDEDDPVLSEYHKEFVALRSAFGTLLDIRILFFQRMFPINTYFNLLARGSSGDLLMCFADDCAMDTENWDEIIEKNVPQYPQDVPFYGDTGDSTRNFNNNGNYACFPIISRAAFNALGYILNPDIITWGSDKFLKYVFEQAGAPIVDLGKVFLTHAHDREDLTHQELYSRFEKNAGQETALDYSADIKRLKEAMKKGGV